MIKPPAADINTIATYSPDMPRKSRVNQQSKRERGENQDADLRG